MTDEPPPLREFALERFRAAFGTPETVTVKAGYLYRWVLECAAGGKLFLTLNAPELPNFAHIILTDPASKEDPVVSLIMRTPAEIEAVIDRIASRRDGSGTR